VVSIAFSAIQYDTMLGNSPSGPALSNGVDLSDAEKSICHNPLLPFKYWSPFNAQIKCCGGAVGPFYCGYSIESTAWRIAIAAFGVLCAIAQLVCGCFAFDQCSPIKAIKSFMDSFSSSVTFLLAIFFYSAFIVDMTSFVNGSVACTHTFFIPESILNKYGLTIDCNNGIYLITCAIDFTCAGLLLFTSKVWSLEKQSSVSGEYGLATAPPLPSSSSASSSKQPSSVEMWGFRNDDF
jgi:hypothetical protein